MNEEIYKTGSFNDLKHELTKDDVRQLVKLLFHSCRKDTKAKAKFNLTNHARSISHHRLFELIKRDRTGKWKYIGKNERYYNWKSARPHSYSIGLTFHGAGDCHPRVFHPDEAKPLRKLIISL